MEFEGQGGGESWFKLEDGEVPAPKPTGACPLMHLGHPTLWALLMGGMMDKMLEDGLAGLKEMAEQKSTEAPAATGSYEVKPMDFPGQTYLGIREKTTHDEVMKSTFFAERLGKIMNLLGKSKMQPAGSPAGVYYTWDVENKTTDMAVAIPVGKGTAVAGAGLKTFEVPASKALVVDYYGPYDNFEAAHEAIGTYLKAKGLKEKPPVIEEYVTDPMTEKDSTKWLTKIIYMIEGN
ncbi:MAG: GyrI-like domain-containing protein [Saprospiraceae bacterium]|nr:GyrI-like domain-containing protein [Saprospiraceae bacterium]